MQDNVEEGELETGTDPDNPSSQVFSNESDDTIQVEEEKDEKKKEEFKKSQAPKVILNRLIELINYRKKTNQVKRKAQITIIILGLSGVGKTYILDKLNEMVRDLKFDDEVKTINIDKFGSLVNSKWKIDVRKMISETKVLDVGIYEGVSDNMTDVLAGVGNLSSEGFEASFYIKPAIELFKSINALKFQEGSEKGLPAAWLAGWFKNSEIEGNDYETLIKKDFERIKKMCEDEDFPSPEIIINEQESEIKSGWHKG